MQDESINKISTDNLNQQIWHLPERLVVDGQDNLKMDIETVQLGADSEAVEISHIILDSGERIRVLEEGREGVTIFVRRLGEKEVDTGETFKFRRNQERLVLTEPIYAVSLHLTPEVGRKDDILTWVRVLPDGRDGSIVYGRTLLPDESDTGLAVQRRPGETFVLRPGSLVFSVEGVDASVATRFEDGYASITNTIWTWLSLYPTLGGATNIPEDGLRFLLAAARRLDGSHQALVSVCAKLTELKTVEYGIRQRNLIFEIVSMVEIAIVAMNRALQMASKLGKHFQLSTPFPASITNKLKAIKEIRDAYEHIEQRAFGKVHNTLHPDALSVFNFERLFQEGVVTYGNYELELHSEAIQILIETREYLKIVASEFAFQHTKPAGSPT